MVAGDEWIRGGHKSLLTTQVAICGGSLSDPASPISGDGSSRLASTVSFFQSDHRAVDFPRPATRRCEHERSLMFNSLCVGENRRSVLLSRLATHVRLLDTLAGRITIQIENCVKFQGEAPYCVHRFDRR